MTTNSPNPVDGDVQALIADCKAEIAEIEKALTTWGDVWIPSLQSKLNRQKVALAALTAEPVAYTDAEELETLRKGTFADMFTPHESYKSDQLWIPLYTTTPAQLLRQVELPKPIQQTEASDYGLESRDGYGLYWGSVETLKLAAESLRQQGYEVKS